MMHRPIERIATLAILAWSMAGSSVVLADELPPALRACAAEPDSLKRLNCYDREVARAGGGLTKSDAASAADQARDATPAVPAAPATPATPEERFGYRGEITKEAVQREKEKAPSLESLTAKVTDIGRRPRGEMVVTLENGQVWVQKFVDARFQLEEGDTVEIKAASLGSFLMVHGKHSTRVSRVR
ncbi:MAG: hypothetical protein R3E77_02805 [Steroidobacteraceae bacterium]